MKEADIKGARHMTEVNESMKFINEKFEEMEADRKEKERQTLEIKNKVKKLNEKVETMDRSLYRHEQYSRRNCLLIHGVKENEKEDTDEVVMEILKNKCKKKYQSVTWTYPINMEKIIPEVHLGLLSSNLPGTMFKMQFLEKKILKGRPVSITENLTIKRITEVKIGRDTFGFKNVWLQDRKILYTDANDRNKIKAFYD